MSGPKDLGLAGNVAAGCGAVVIGGAAVVVMTALHLVVDAWAIQLLWNWFAVPLVGAPVLTLAHAMGVSVLAAILGPAAARVPESECEEGRTKAVLIHAFSTALLRPALLVAIGWCVKTWMWP